MRDWEWGRNNDHFLLGLLLLHSLHESRMYTQIARHGYTDTRKWTCTHTHTLTHHFQSAGPARERGVGVDLDAQNPVENQVAEGASCTD